MILRNGAIGKSYIVKELNLPKEAERRLEILGMTENPSIDVVNKKKSGSMIIKDKRYKICNRQRIFRKDNGDGGVKING